VYLDFPSVSDVIVSVVFHVDQYAAKVSAYALTPTTPSGAGVSESDTSPPNVKLGNETKEKSETSI